MWTECDLSVEGPRESIKCFMENSISKGQFTFEILMPPPSNISNQGIYRWRRIHWGTRMDAFCVPIYEGNVEGYIQELPNTFYWGVSFDAIDSPPIEWLKTVACMFPRLEFSLTYLERTTPFCGGMSLKNGKVISNENADQYSDHFYELAERKLGYNREYFEQYAPMCQGA